jgi:hypothetical protein
MDMSDSRKSTIEHLRRLASLAALTATACKPGGPKEDSGTSMGYGVVDPMVPPALDAGSVPTIADAGATDSGRKDAGPHTIKVPALDITSTAGGGGGGGPGYGVVDPMPPPTLRRR